MCIYHNYYLYYKISEKIVVSIFDIDINSRSIDLLLNTKEFNIDKIKYIRSTTKSIESKPFFCGLKTTGESICLIYDLDDFKSYTFIVSDDENIKKCKITPYNIKTYYFPETDQYVFSCLTEDNEIQTAIYKKGMSQIEEIENPSMRLIRKFSGCDEFYYSIIYSSINKKYYIISDINCGSYKQFFPLIEEEIEVEEEEESQIEEIEITDEYFEYIEEKVEINFEEKNLYEEEIKEEKIENMIHTEEELGEEEINLNDGLKEEEMKEETHENEFHEEEEEKVEKKEYELKSEIKEEEKIEESNLDSSDIESENENENMEEIEKVIEKEEEIEIENNNCLEKCSKCDEESNKLNLCKKCNTNKGYFPLNTGMNSEENIYINCYNEITKPEGFYLDQETKEYKLCYSNCKTCNYGGDGNENNCTSCKNNQILKPDIPFSSNCVTKCQYFYYYQGDQYKCTSIENCPENYQYEIPDKMKCIDKCDNDNQYIYQYDSECYKELPVGTQYDVVNKVCKDIDTEKCKLKEKILRLKSNENITDHEIELKAKLYAKEFDYTDEHVTIYKNNFYSITLYKDGECSSKLGLNIDEIDFGDCYSKVKDEKGINGNLIIVIISKIINGISITLDKFIFNPNSGEKIDFIEICNGETLTVKKNLKEQIKNNENFESLEELAEQGINIFDINSNFYTDLCFHFKSPIDGKDIPVKDRLKLFFPNITLCDEGCNIKGINLTTWKAICECTLNNLMNNNIFGNNLLLQKSFGEVQDILTKTNIEVMKCYKDLLDFEMYKKNTGLIIILILLIIQIIFILIYYCKYKNKIKKFVLAITDKFLSSSYFKKNSNLNLIDSNIDIIKCSPPKNNSNFEINPVNGKEKKIKKKTVKKGLKTMVIKRGQNKKSTKSVGIKRKFPYKNSFNSNDNINHTEKPVNNKNDIELIMPENNDIININIDEYMKTDPDDMDYDEAIKEDKRTFCQYFYNKIKTEQIILSTFLKYEVLKPMPLKIVLLLLDIDLYLIINALFFNENFISDLLNSVSDTIGSFIDRLFYRIVIITITGVIINYVVKFFFTEEGKTRRIFKREKNNIIILKYEIVQLIKNIHLKFNIFIVLSSIIMIFSLYYIFCFNNVYPCIKEEWLKSSLIIISIMQILPIFLAFLDASIRFISFRCKSERLFRLSSIFL